MKKIFTLLLSVLLLSTLTAAARPAQASATVNLSRAEDGHFFIKGEIIAPTNEDGTTYDEGAPLEYIDKIYVTRSCYYAGENGVPVTEFIDPEPGATLSFEDHEVQKGYEYTYSIFVVVDDVQSWGTYLYTPYVGVKLNMPDLTLSLPEDGMPPVSITIIAPNGTSSGEAYEGTMSLVLSRREGWGTSTVIKTFENVSAGETVTWEDTPEKLSTSYYYLVKAECEDGGSDEQQRSIFVGRDLPGAPSDVNISLNEDGSVLISWGEPKYGVNSGNFLTPVHYTVTRNDGKVIVEDTTELSVVDPCDDLTGPTNVAYSIYAFNADGGDTSRGTATSGKIVAGPPAGIPFIESFNNGGYYPEPSNIWSYDYNWSFSKYDWYSELTGVNGDSSDYDSYEGYAECYLSSYGSAFETHELTTPTLDMSGSVNPVLSFYYHPTDGESTLRVYTIQGEDKQLVYEQPVKEGIEDVEKTPWVQVFVALPHAANHGATALSFVAAGAEDPYDNCYCTIDEIEIDDYPYVLKPVATVNTDDATITLEWEDPSTATKTAERYTVSVNDEPVISTTVTTYVHSAEPNTDYKMAVHAHYGSFMAEAPESEHVLTTLGTQSGVENVTLADDAVSVEYYNLQGIRVETPAAGSTIIRRAVKADGSVSTGKVVVR